jgi:type II secretory pathway pseudopilin PulG
MRKPREAGFAMLFVLLMASLVAITFYMALPRFAFEAQRDKEQTLIDRGEQYKRAIQVYVRQNKRFPAKIEDLEDTNGKRYLRKRYVDPMTGKDEWRPIHVGPNGVLTDSLIKKDTKGTGSTYSNNFITELQGLGSAPDPTGAVNPALRRRPSDGPTQNLDPSQISQNIPIQITQGQIGPVPVPPGQGIPGQTQQLAGVGYPPVQPGAALGSPYSTAPGANGTPLTPMPGQLQGQLTGMPQGNFGGQPGAPASAAQLIQGLLTSPRPGGAPGTSTGSPMGQIQGGGIAGFASKFEGEGIKTYNEQTEYQKWEFVYDMNKDPMMTGGMQGIPQPPGPNSTAGQMGSATPTTTTPTDPNAPANPLTPPGTVVK